MFKQMLKLRGTKHDGWTIIDVARRGRRRPGAPRVWIALARKGNEWVTWTVYTEAIDMASLDKPRYAHGHYFGDAWYAEWDARADFRRRYLR